MATYLTLMQSSNSPPSDILSFILTTMNLKKHFPYLVATASYTITAVFYWVDHVGINCKSNICQHTTSHHLTLTIFVAKGLIRVVYIAIIDYTWAKCDEDSVFLEHAGHIVATKNQVNYL